VSFLESEFGVEILEEELGPANFGTIRDVTRLVDSKRKDAKN
jgi:acyl carrier protein